MTENTKRFKLLTIIKNRYFREVCFFVSYIVIMIAFSCNQKTVPAKNSSDNYELVWSDEFNKEGKPDSTKWNDENGFVRNEEFQWYQA